MTIFFEPESPHLLFALKAGKQHANISPASAHLSLDEEQNSSSVLGGARGDGGCAPPHALVGRQPAPQRGR